MRRASSPARAPPHAATRRSTRLAAREAAAAPSSSEPPVAAAARRLVCWPGSEPGWLLFDNNGSWSGWFDFLPRELRVGPWHPTAFLFLVLLYASLVALRPPLDYPITSAAAPAYGAWWWADVGVVSWSAVVVSVSWRRYGGGWPYAISYTGWSWVLLTARALLTALGTLLDPSESRVALALARAGSALRFPAFAGAVVTFAIWNFVLVPMLLMLLPVREQSEADAARRTHKKGSQWHSRGPFLRFNFSFFMSNVHIANLPLASLNVVYGAGARVLGTPDLWIALVVVGGYSLLYLGLLDRIGMHFYPMFSPRSRACLVAYVALFAIYFGIYEACRRWLATD